MEKVRTILELHDTVWPVEPHAPRAGVSAGKYEDKEAFGAVNLPADLK